MDSINFSSYSKTDLENVLRILKDYRVARKQIGNRAVVRDPKIGMEKAFQVHYPENVDISDIQPTISWIITKYFPEKKQEDIVYKRSKNIKGWIRIFDGDDLVDISFENFVQKF